MKKPMMRVLVSSIVPLSSNLVADLNLEWAGSDDDYGSSEPMGESITDICNPLMDDLDPL